MVTVSSALWLPAPPPPPPPPLHAARVVALATAMTAAPARTNVGRDMDVLLRESGEVSDGRFGRCTRCVLWAVRQRPGPEAIGCHVLSPSHRRPDTCR